MCVYLRFVVIALTIALHDVFWFLFQYGTSHPAAPDEGKGRGGLYDSEEETETVSLIWLASGHQLEDVGSVWYMYVSL